MSSRFYKSN